MDSILIAVICVFVSIVLIGLNLAKEKIKEQMDRLMHGPKLTPQKDTVILYQVGRGPRAPSVSPFPLKLETFMRMARIPYMNDHTGRFSSKGKTPWMEYNGQHVADSQLCIEYLKKETGCDLNSTLTEYEAGVARAIQKMTEENLYWTMCEQSFFTDAQSHLKELIPYGPIKRLLVLTILKRVLRLEMWGHGIGRHTPKEIWGIGEADLTAISHILGTKPYFMGSEPTELDCCMFGMLAQIRWHMRDTQHEQLMTGKLINLVEYCDRMKERFWPDWDQRITLSDSYSNDHGMTYTHESISPE